MEDKDIKELQQLLDKFENEDLQNVSKDTRELQSYSEYAGTTPTEKKVINNASLIANSMNNTNKINKKLFEINAQIFKSLIKMEGSVDDTEKRINEYLESIKTETTKTIMDYKAKILTSADSEVKTFEDKQIQKAFETFGITTVIIAIVVILFVVWLMYCFIKGRS